MSSAAATKGSQDAARRTYAVGRFVLLQPLLRLLALGIVYTAAKGKTQEKNEKLEMMLVICVGYSSPC